MTLLEKINYLMIENGLNKRQLSIKSGVPYSTIDGFYKVGYENMRLPTFKTICDFFKVTMDSMAYDDREIRYLDEKTPESLDKNERELLTKYNMLNDEGQLFVRKQADYATTQPEYKKDTSGSHIKTEAPGA